MRAEEDARGGEAGRAGRQRRAGPHQALRRVEERDASMLAQNGPTPQSVRGRGAPALQRQRDRGRVHVREGVRVRANDRHRIRGAARAYRLLVRVQGGRVQREIGGLQMPHHRFPDHGRLQGFEGRAVEEWPALPRLHQGATPLHPLRGPDGGHVEAEREPEGDRVEARERLVGRVPLQARNLRRRAQVGADTIEPRARPTVRKGGCSEGVRDPGHGPGQEADRHGGGRVGRTRPGHVRPRPRRVRA